MPAEGSIPNHTRRANGLEPIGVVIEFLKARVNQAIAERDEEAAAQAHDDLTSAEHRQRMQERSK